MSVVIRVENLSKRYQLGELSRKTFFAGLRRKVSGQDEPDEGASIFWALRDLSFDVAQGDVLGVLGRNGAGKSTLLKIISGITAPTRGAVKIRGRIASLLEVGTGFHQELTGRDNIFLNGTILGMSRAEVTAKLDEIIAFSGVEKFIDTPVKRYSSGMRVRLAFAVAAHLEPEILVADEVLAVGDSAFQQRCLGQLDRLSKSGRTVLFVSHNSAAIASLCKRGIVLDCGRMAFDGNQNEALDFYGRSNPTAEVGGLNAERTGSGEIQVISVELRTANGQPTGAARCGQDIELWIRYRRNVEGRWPALSVRIHVATEFEAPVFAQFNDLTRESLATESGEIPETGIFVCRLPALQLSPGVYNIDTVVSTGRVQGAVLDKLSPALRLVVEGGDFYGTGQIPASKYGPMLAHASWRLEH